VSLDSLFGFAQTLGIFKKLKDKLTVQPDPAAKHLAEILEQLANTFDAIDTEINDYLGLWFNAKNPYQIAKARKKLLELEGGKVKVRISQVRVHCHKIGSIYEKYLDKWFKKVLSPTEYNELKGIFWGLSVADDTLSCVISNLGCWLEKRARRIQELLDETNYTQANQEIQKDRIEVRANREKLVQVMQDLYTLQAEFIKVSKII
jgi:hypothetical protein